MATLGPPPLDTVLENKEGNASPPWARWLRQLWDTVRGSADLATSLGTVANTKGTQTFEGKTLTAPVLNDSTGANLTISNIKDSTRAYAKAGTGAGQSFPSGAVTIINFGTVAYDSRSAITTGAAWKYTVPAGMGGIYLVSATVLFAPGTAGNAELHVYRDGSGGNGLDLDSLSAAHAGLSGSALIQLNAGQYIDFRIYHGLGVNRALHADAYWNHVSIIRMVTDL